MSDVSELLRSAIDHFGSQAKLGAAAGVSQNAIWSAKQKGSVSAELASAIHRATKGRVPRWKLRPDIWNAPRSAKTDGKAA
jgi:DNA-binding transcriptional regulator YdaS (Cro superfamily)